MNTRAVFLPADGVGEPWVLGVEDGGRVQASGPLRDTAVEAAYTVLVAPGAQALARWVDLPARTDAQARSAAAFLLEDELATPRGSTHISLGPSAGPGRRLVVVVDKAQMRAWLDAAGTRNIRPDVVIPDHLLLDPPGDGVALAVTLGPMVAVRAADLAATCEPDLAKLIAGDRRIQRVEDAKAAEALFAAGAAAPLVNLLQGEFAVRAPTEIAPKALRLPAFLLAAALALPIVSDGARFVRHSTAAHTAEREARAAALAILPPDAADAAYPLAAALARAGEIDARGAGGFLASASALFAGIEAAPSMQLVSLLYTPDGAMRATVRTADVTAIEALRRFLYDAGFAVDEGGSTTQDGATLTEITVRAGR